MDNRFVRQEILLGTDAMQKLADSHVAVFGLGGVGSWTAEALARAGVGEITLIDHDDYGPTNINRQLGALTSTMGMGKAEVMAGRVLDINPCAAVHVFKEKYSAQTREQLLASGYDFIIDAIDMVSSKLDLIETAIRRGIPIISSLGMGNRVEPSGFVVTDISKTKNDPLARVVRKELRRRGISHHLVLACTGEPSAASASDEAPPPGRRSIPGSVCWVTACAGMMLAGETVLRLCGIKRENHALPIPR
ncbi:MAG: tRNA threonylcarbamoyladenosine dehydratase [Clostridiales bacterium]|nr:tRNA threonylcarbamoyladenosine dehydratase [Clostridiales bacterium]